MRTLVLGLALVTSLVCGGLVVACGSSGDNVSIGGEGGDGTGDGSAGNGDGALGSMFGNDGGWNGGSAEGGAASTCQKLGLSCKANADCCTGDCLGGACQPPSCTSDGKACAASAECCGGTCTGGNCAALNATCKTLGNACAANGDCCSSYCESGICAQPSFCGQNGDICTTGTDCCGGTCTLKSGSAFGTCAQPASIGAQCSMIDGVVCDNGGVTTYTDAGIPTCGGACCSRSCAPWGPTGILICQPASGCHPVGDICAKSSDCCGGSGAMSNVACNKASPTDALGVCGNPKGCKPDGDICRLKSNQCNATDNCCSGNVQQNDNCRQDALGVPRCSYGKGSMCVPAAGGCASSADCCNLNPCVPNPSGTPAFVCAATQCVPNAGACSTDADCCDGSHCTVMAGSTAGTCVGPTGGGGSASADGGSGTGGGCAFYGQVCTQGSDCCNGVPCTGGRCVSPIK